MRYRRLEKGCFSLGLTNNGSLRPDDFSSTNQVSLIGRYVNQQEIRSIITEDLRYALQVGAKLREPFCDSDVHCAQGLLADKHVRFEPVPRLEAQYGVTQSISRVAVYLCVAREVPGCGKSFHQ